MKTRYALWKILLLSIFVSCEDRSVIDKNISIENRTWLSADHPKFQFHISDASKRYTLFIHIRHTPQYAYSNLAVLIHEWNSKGKKVTFLKDIRLARADGSWTGASSANLYMNKSLIHNHYSFPDTGSYQIAIEQNMHDNPLSEITDIGLQIIPE